MPPPHPSVSRLTSTAGTAQVKKKVTQCIRHASKWVTTSSHTENKSTCGLRVKLLFSAYYTPTFLPSWSGWRQAGHHSQWGVKGLFLARCKPAISVSRGVTSCAGWSWIWPSLALRNSGTWNVHCGALCIRLYVCI